MKNILAGLLIACAFITLIGLGTWQVKRLQWKQEIITKLEKVYAQDTQNSLLSFDDIKITDEENPVLYGALEGKFNYSKEILYGPRTLDGKIGYYVINPLKLTSGGEVFVNRGFITNEEMNKLSSMHLQGIIRVSGLLRKTDWNKFTPENNPQKNIWTKLDIEYMGKAKNIKNIAPLMMFAEKSSKDFKVLKMHNEKWMPRNKHKQYAIFWYTMAFVLCGLVGFYAWSMSGREGKIN